jgi:hypothetical protein
MNTTCLYKFLQRNVREYSANLQVSMQGYLYLKGVVHEMEFKHFVKKFIIQGLTESILHFVWVYI